MTRYRVAGGSALIEKFICLTVEYFTKVQTIILKGFACSEQREKFFRPTHNEEPLPSCTSSLYK